MMIATVSRFNRISILSSIGYASEVTSTSVVLTTSDISSSITSISFAVFSSSKLNNQPNHY